jgi:DNA repair protein RecN (Recombination protein N)
MLTYLQIRDFALIENVELELGPGLTVLTGETGAGKSMLVDALGLVLGDRAEPRQIRAGCDRAEVTAEFDLGDLDPPRAWLDERGLADAGQCLIRRVVARAGRSRAFINGTPVTLQDLKALGELLADIHGQHEHQSLLRAESQRRMLDTWGRNQPFADTVATAYRAWNEAETARTALADDQVRDGERRALLRFQLDELNTLAPQPGEFAALGEEHRRLAHADELVAALGTLCDGLYEADEGSVHDRLGRAARELAELQRLDPTLANPAEVLEEALIRVQESASGLRHCADRIDLDPGRLAQVERRLEALHETGRKYRVAPDELPQLHASLVAELGDDEDPDTRLARLTEAATVAAAEYHRAATELSRQRAAAGEALGEMVTESLQLLAMPGGRFAVELQPLDDGQGSVGGNEQVRFLVSANPDQPPLPLGQVASGGELSRISLAIQAATAASVDVPTLVYDEVDVGIGGRVAEIVGRLLRDLAEARQVFCITHLPQVAAQAHGHLQVNKQSEEAVTTTAVTPLDREARIEELARMLGGLKITAQTRAHAEEMIELARTG